MMSSQYVREIINEVAGQEAMRLVATTPEYLGLLKAHTDGLPPEEVSDYEKWFQDKLRFVFDCIHCSRKLYLDYSCGRVDFPIEEVVRDIIGELIKLRYPTKYVMILNDVECQRLISNYANGFRNLLKERKGVGFAEFYGNTQGHFLVNMFSGHLSALEKESQLVPLRLYEDGESLNSNVMMDGSGLYNTVGEEEPIPDYIADIRNGLLSYHKSIKAKLGCSLAILIVILLIVYLTTASLNPLAVYNTNNTLVKVLVSVLAGLLAFLFLMMSSMHILMLKLNFDMRKSVEIGTGRSADSAICPSCGLSVFLNEDTLGLPIVCHKCHVAWHDGPKCYRKGMPPSNDSLPSYPCPNCRSSE